MKELKKDNAGFSLIELLLSIIILAMIAVPLLNNFTSATKLNTKSKKIQNATIIAQNLLESLKVEKMEEISKKITFPEYFNLLGDDVTVNTMTELSKKVGLDTVYEVENNKSTTMNEDVLTHKKTYQFNKKEDVYYFTLGGINQGDYQFHALITLDMKPYKNQANTTTNYNDFQMPSISEIESDYNAVISKHYDDDVVETFWSMNVADCSARSNEDRTYYPLSKTEIRNNTTKNIEVKVKSIDSTYFNVTVKYHYNCIKSDGVRVAGTTPIDYIVYSENIKKEQNNKNNIYIFYSPLIDNTNVYTLSQIKDTITYSNIDEVPLSLCVIAQDSVYGTNSEKKEPPEGYQMKLETDETNDSTKVYTTKVYSNLTLFKNIGLQREYTGKMEATSGNYVERNPLADQIYDVKVQIFNQKDILVDTATNPNTYQYNVKPIVELHSTKGE